MTSDEKVYSLKTVVIVMSILLVGCFFYIFQFSNDTKNLVTAVKKQKTEKEIVTERLEKLKASYEEAISKKTPLSTGLIAERDKVIALLEQVKESNDDPKFLAKLKQKSIALEGNKKGLVAKNKVAFATQKSPETTKFRTDSIVQAKAELAGGNKTITTKYKESNKTGGLSSKPSVVSLSARSYRVRDTGNEVQTDKASKVNQLKISFTIPESVLVAAGAKNFEIQIIDGNNNVIGEKKTEIFGEKTLIYSFAKQIDYQNKAVEVVENFMIESLEEGIYSVNVFLRGELMSTSKITLR